MVRPERFYFGANLIRVGDDVSICVPTDDAVRELIRHGGPVIPSVARDLGTGRSNHSPEFVALLNAQIPRCRSG